MSAVGPPTAIDLVVLEQVPCPLCGDAGGRPALDLEELSLRARSRTRWTVARCDRCRLAYVDRRVPRPAEEAYADDDYGFRRSPLADALIDDRPHAARVLDEIETTTAPGRLLDVGCGAGELLLAARRRGWTTRGVEVSPQAAAVARARGLEVVVGTLEEAGLAPGSFDCVTLLDVIEHLPDPLRELREIRRVLRPGGLLSVETPNWQSIYRHLLGARWAALQPRLHLLYFDRRSLGRLLLEAGFEPLQATTEIVSLLSPEALRRGLGPAWVRGALRDLVVRWLLSRQPGLLDALFLRLRPTRDRATGDGSYRSLVGSVAPARPDPTSRRLRLLRLLNRPIDRLFLGLGMGEQLRVVAKAD